MWLHSQVGHTYNSRVEVRSAECACGKAMLPVRTIATHAFSLYENAVNGTSIAWYKSSNIHPFIQNWVRVRVWSVVTTFMQGEMQCVGCDFDVNAYLPLVC